LISGEIRFGIFSLDCKPIDGLIKEELIVEKEER